MYEMCEAVCAGDAYIGEPKALVFDLLTDNITTRKRINDYTEGLLQQTAQRMEQFKMAYEQVQQKKKKNVFAGNK